MEWFHENQIIQVHKEITLQKKIYFAYIIKILLQTQNQNLPSFTNFIFLSEKGRIM